jgi:hypothetical protein
MVINVKKVQSYAANGIPRNFFGGGQQIQLTEGRENRDMVAVAP